MPIPPEFLPALSLIHARLKDAPVRWAITGSLGMVLQGMPLTVHDIDLQTDSDGVYLIQDQLLEYVTQPVYWREAGNMRSHFGVMDIDGIQVEVMGEIEKRLPTGAWTPPPDLSEIIRWVDEGGMHLPVMDLEYEYEAYRLMGRAEKAEKIRQFLNQHSH